MHQKFNTSFRVIRRFMRVVSEAGYDAFFVNKSRRNTMTKYIAFQKHGDLNMSFIIRFSDHLLRSGNYYPAGVINYAEDIKNCVRSFNKWKSIYTKMTPKEIDELWTNHPA